MIKVRLNKHGSKLYPWLAGVALPVYGYNTNNYSFVIWDYVLNEWKDINQNFCEGETLYVDRRFRKSNPKG